MVYNLKKALYGLKQAPRAWYGKIDSYLVQFGLRMSKIEPILHLKQDNSDLQLVVSLFVDNMLVT